MKKIILSLLSLLVVGTMTAQNQMHVNMNDGSTLNLYVAEIKNITWDYSAPDDPVENDPEEQTVTGEAKEITENSASITSYANNILDNEATDLKMGIIYCTSGTPSKSNGTQKTVSKSQIAADGKYTVTLTGLSRGTTYYYRSFVYQSGLWFYGKVRSFSTIGQEIDAQFSTGSATGITCFSAKVSAQMTLKASLSYSSMSYGICYGKTAEPTQTQAVNSKDASGSYSTTLRALEGNTVYYYRPYAQVDGVMYYGSTSSFQTLADNVVKTGDADADGWVKSRLTIGGGAYSSLEVGLCWSSSNQTPTVADQTASTNELDDENYYNLQIEDWGTIYYCAYVKIDGVAHYGAVKTIKIAFIPKSVDLGLSVKWANCNVGATAPEEYGDYFAWGETTAKTTYNWSTYKYCNGSNTTQTKYCTSSGYGTVDKKTELEPADDAATANCGGAWRMPTDAELNELRTNCTWTWTTQNGVFGYEVTGKNGNSIFLPAAGSCNDSSLYGAGSYGDYWSSSLSTRDSGYAYGLNFNSGHVYRYGSDRCLGYSVRPVCQ